MTSDRCKATYEYCFDNDACLAAVECRDGSCGGFSVSAAQPQLQLVQDCGSKQTTSDDSYCRNRCKSVIDTCNYSPDCAQAYACASNCTQNNSCTSACLINNTIVGTYARSLVADVAHCFQTCDMDRKCQHVGFTSTSCEARQSDNFQCAWNSFCYPRNYSSCNETDYSACIQDPTCSWDSTLFVCSIGVHPCRNITSPSACASSPFKCNWNTTCSLKACSTCKSSYQSCFGNDACVTGVICDDNSCGTAAAQPQLQLVQSCNAQCGLDCYSFYSKSSCDSYSPRCAWDLQYRSCRDCLSTNCLSARC